METSTSLPDFSEAMGPFNRIIPTQASDQGWDRLVDNENIAIVALATLCLFLAMFNLIQYYSSRKSDREWRASLGDLSKSMAGLSVGMASVVATMNTINMMFQNKGD